MEIKHTCSASKIYGLEQLGRRQLKQQYLEGHEGMGTDAVHILRGVCCDHCFVGLSRRWEKLESTVSHA